MSQVECSVEDGIATLLINRPDALNSLSGSVLRELGESIAVARKEASIHAVIVTGAGRAFVAGADIEEISQLDQRSGLEFSRLG